MLSQLQNSAWSSDPMVKVLCGHSRSVLMGRRDPDHRPEVQVSWPLSG